MSKAMRDWEADEERLRARLAEYEEAHRITVNDCGAPDEQHCSCVPSLRLEAKRLQARLAEAHQLLQDALIYGCDGQWAKRLAAHLGAADSAEVSDARSS
jgi:hypothetical protein